MRNDDSSLDHSPFEDRRIVRVDQSSLLQIDDVESLITQKCRNIVMDVLIGEKGKLTDFQATPAVR